MNGALGKPRQARSWRTSYNLSASGARLQEAGDEEEIQKLKMTRG